MNYPRDYRQSLEWRAKLLDQCEADEQYKAYVKDLFHRDVLFAFNAFFFTLDVRKRPQHHQPFVTWAFQDKTLLKMKESIDFGQDILIEKSRDMGASWMVIGLFTWFWLDPRGGYDFLLGSRIEDYVDKRGDMRTLMEKVRYLLDRLPPWLRPKGFSREKHDNYMRIFNPESGSSITGESNNPNFSTGGRYAAILLDEFAKWESSDKSAWTAAGDATPCRIPVSTPFGAAGQYYELAMDGKTEKVTLHWSLHPEKGAESYCRWPKEDVLHDIQLVRSPWFDLECARRTDTEIAQELQIDYVGAGRPVFDGKAGKSLLWYHNEYRQNPPKPKYYDLENEVYVPELIHGDQRNILLMFQDPDPAADYIIVADVAEGLEHGDYSPIGVINCQTLNLDAVHHAQTNEVLLASYIKKTADLYSNPDSSIMPPLVVIETNGPGLATFDRCVLLDVPNLFMMPRYDTTKGTTTYKKGWRTDAYSRQEIIASLREYLTNRTGHVNYLPLIRECMTFVRNRTGKAEAKEGCNDDLVMMFGIGLCAFQACPAPPRKAAKPVVKELNDIMAQNTNDIEKRTDVKSLQEQCFDDCMRKKKQQESVFDDLFY